MSETGVLAGPVAGLRYRTPTCSGLTDENGRFHYVPGERVAFLVGEIAIGYTLAAPRVSLAQIISRVDGNVAKLRDPGLTNVARFLCSLDRDGNLDGGLDIPPEVHAVIGRRALDFRVDVSFAVRVSDRVRAFEEDPAVAAVLDELGRSGVFTAGLPRALCSAAAARNEVRRHVSGIRRFRDVMIPLGNGSHVFADVFRPDRPGKFPVIMNCGVYGRAFHHHSICGPTDFEEHEEEEDRYFDGNPEGLLYENHETVNTVDWVPHDYVVIRVDGPGTGRSPGRLAPWGFATAKAYHDAIEWAGEQPWSNGHVGLWGMSYYAMTQHAVASLQPKHLKAMIAIGTDVDLYEELVYTGGVLNEEFFPVWFRAGVLPAVCGTPDPVDFMAIARGAPFKDSDPERIFGPTSEVFMSPDMSAVRVPLWAVACTTHPAHFHQLGGSEAYLATRTTDKKIDFWEDWFTRSYTAASIADHRAFFDHWLKGVDNGIMDKPPVRLEIRAGDGSSFVLEENEWPIERTRYVKWFLDASASSWAGDEWRDDFRTLSLTPPEERGEAAYSAEVPLESRTGPSPALMPVKPPAALLAWKTGLSFVSDPLEEDMVFAGYSKVTLWVASTSEDMDLFVSLRVIDENDRLVDHAGPVTIGMSTRNFPLAKGWLKVSHRKRDETRSTAYTVKHTHLRADHAPLRDGEIVPVEVEIIPSTALLRKGYRIRLDIQPFDGFDHGSRHGYDPSYHDGAQNMIYTGPGRESFVQLPIVPARDDG